MKAPKRKRLRVMVFVLGGLGLGGLIALFIRRSRRNSMPIPVLPPVAQRPLTPAEKKRLALLVPETQKKIIALLAATAAKGVQLFIGSTDRSPAEQLEKIKQGRSGATRSWHLAARAADIYIINPKTGKPDTDGKDNLRYSIMGKTAEQIGLVWLGLGEIKTKYGSYRDPNHVQDSKGITWAQAMASISRSPNPVVVA